MPHLFIEYTDNLTGLDERALMRELNAVVCGQPSVADEADVKARIARLSNFFVGTQPEQRGFVHVQLRWLAGRSEQAKKEVSDGLAAVLRQLPKPEGLMVQLSVEVAELDKPSYFKGRL